MVWTNALINNDSNKSFVYYDLYLEDDVTREEGKFVKLMFKRKSKVISQNNVAQINDISKGKVKFSIQVLTSIIGFRYPRPFCCCCAIVTIVMFEVKIIL